jgi:ferredoxin
MGCHQRLQEGANITSEHGLSKFRKKKFQRAKNETASMTHQTGGTASQHDSDLKLSVDLERCVRCGKCEKVCPTGAIMVDEDIFRVDSSRCNGCGQCIERCRHEALSLRNNGGEPFDFEPRICLKYRLS